jgi:signal transduction histidine kinase/DNA-binding response OmpR family regulator
VTRFRDLSVKRKLTAITMVAAGVALFLAGAAMVAYELITYREEKVTRLSTQAEIVGSNAASALLFTDPQSAAATLAALRAEPRVVSARIHTPDGAVFARYDRDERGPRDTPAAPPPAAGHAFTDGGLLVYRPIVLEGARVGTVVILSDLAEMTAMLRRYGLILLVVFLVSLAVAHVTASRLHRMITAPVLGLVETANAVSSRRDYSVRAVAGGEDELGLLVRSFNDMLGQIQQRDAALQRARGELEGQVADRTRSLQGEIAERKVLEEELRAKNRELEEQSRRVQEATRLKSEFLANMSHELRTPLNAIIGFAELMHDGKVGPVSTLHKECLDDILTSSRHLLHLINDVLDLSKVEAGKMEFRPEPVDLERLLGEVRDILRGLAAEKRIRLAVAVEPGLGDVVIDPGKLKQVLYNFLSNALKFTAEGGNVTVRARAEGDGHFRLEVQDDGIGIRPEDLGRLFAEFQQLDASAAKPYAGTGLGLALTKRIVEAQGGHVGVSSVYGRGSVFHAVLPRVTRAGAEAPLPVRRAPRAGAPTLLVIEDDTRERAWLVETLSAAGYAVQVAATGAEAIERCGARTFDGITLDLLLPDMGGWEVLKAIRAGGPNQATPTVVVTVVAEKGVGAGYAIHDYLAKPVRAEELLASLRRAGLRPTVGRPVLVVDDDPQARRLMETMLTALGYATIEAAGGEEGLLLAQREAPAAVILDLYMPGMDGFGFLERFRAMPAGHGTPVIVWTVKDLTAADHARLAASAQAVVLKGGTGRLIEELRTHVDARAGAAAAGEGAGGS